MGGLALGEGEESIGREGRAATCVAEAGPGERGVGEVTAVLEDCPSVVVLCEASGARAVAPASPVFGNRTIFFFEGADGGCEEDGGLPHMCRESFAFRAGIGDDDLGNQYAMRDYRVLRMDRIGGPVTIGPVALDLGWNEK